MRIEHKNYIEKMKMKKNLFFVTNFSYTTTELQLIQNLVLGKTGLVVLVAEYPIPYLASFFFIYPKDNYLCLQKKGKDNAKQISKKRLKKNIISF